MDMKDEMKRENVRLRKRNCELENILHKIIMSAATTQTIIVHSVEADGVDPHELSLSNVDDWFKKVGDKWIEN